MDYRTKQYRAKQVLYRAARWLLGDGNGDQSRWARGAMYENDVGMPYAWEPPKWACTDCGAYRDGGCRCCVPSGACALGGISVATFLLCGRDNDDAREVFDAAALELQEYLRYEYPKRDEFKHDGMEISLFNDEVAMSVEEVAGALKAAAGPPQR